MPMNETRTPTLEAPSYDVFKIPVPASLSDLANYRALRLLALRTDPTSFSSTLKREAAFTEEEWRARLDSQDKVTVVAVKGARSSGSEDNTERKWVGMVTLLAPEAIVEGMGLPRIGKRTYPLFGMWVHPEHRGRGVGKMLVAESLSWAEMKCEGGLEGAIVVLEVKEDNTAASALYTAMGFKVLHGDGVGDDGRLWMVRHLKEER